jgi:transcriptional regulator with XRE-family HTH domain
MLRLKVKEIAEEQGISMHKLSQISQVSYNIIKDIFKNPTRTVNSDTINRIAKALGIPVTDLIEDVPEEATHKKDDSNS